MFCRILSLFRSKQILFLNVDSLKEINKQNIQILENQKTIMAAIDNLNEALQRLAKATDTAVTVLNTPHPTEEAIQAAADLVQAQAQRLESASDNDPSTIA
jgi:cell division protein ZapA (FtsZ GTPase activity inhibitor)